MKIEIKNPPNNIREMSEKLFKLEGEQPVWTYGDTIYNPYNGALDEFLIAHEYVHSEQQGDDPETWWRRYFIDKEFRLSQELPAYRVQYRMFKDLVKDRNHVDKFLRKLAQNLSGAIYGNLCSYSEAYKKIKV